ncbi:MAG: sulfatase [Acidobacteria bacterium]|nr:sulfatase [Acidobacteriota bacterium]
MTPRCLCAVVALLAAVSCGQRAPEQAAEPRKPNIILFVADDLGWTDLTSYGSQYYETPNIDRLAREGMKFSDAYANPNCAPTRAALLTGRYSPRTGIYTVDTGARGEERFRKMIPAENNTTLALDEVTFAEVLRGAGYATAHMGKWHMGGEGNLPTEQGFDLNVGGNHSGSPKGGYFAPWNNAQMPDAPEGTHLADVFATEASKFMEQNRDKPFLLYLPFYSVHTPIQAKPELVEKYTQKPGAGGQSNPKYAAMIETMDTAIGVVLDKLAELGLENDTFVFFYSDNGGVGGYHRAGVDANDITDNAPLRGGKGMLYEGGIRVPLLVRKPGLIPPGSFSQETVMCVDFLPTLAEIAGVAPPKDRDIDGVSFYPTFRSAGKSPSPRPPIYWHFPGYLQGKADVGAWRTTPAGALRIGRYKIIEFFETGDVELYNLEEDISEQNNLIKLMPQKAADMQAELRAWRERTGAPMPTPR